MEQRRKNLNFIFRQLKDLNYISNIVIVKMASYNHLTNVCASTRQEAYQRFKW